MFSFYLIAPRDTLYTSELVECCSPPKILIRDDGDDNLLCHRGKPQLVCSNTVLIHTVRTKINILFTAFLDLSAKVTSNENSEIFDCELIANGCVQACAFLTILADSPLPLRFLRIIIGATYCGVKWSRTVTLKHPLQNPSTELHFCSGQVQWWVDPRTAARAVHSITFPFWLYPRRRLNLD